MRRTNVVRLMPDRPGKECLRVLGDRCSALWNRANYLCRQALLGGEKVPNYSALCEIMKASADYRALPTHIGQEVLKKLSKSWQSFFALRRAHARGEVKDKPGMPRYRKDRKAATRPWGFIPMKSTAAYRVEGNTLHLAVPEDIHKGRTAVPFRGIIRHRGNFKTCELKHDRVKQAWYAHIVVEIPEVIPRSETLTEKHAAGDVGARRTITISIQDHPLSVVYSSRAAWKDYKYWTRQIANEKSRLSTQGYKTSRHLQALYRTRRLRLGHAMEVLASDVVSMLRRHKVTHFTAGHPVNCRDNASFGGGNELVHNFWGFDIMLDILEKHCHRFGIVFERVDERGTSSHCHICGGKVRRPRTDLVICPLHGPMHADVNGSRNILKKEAPALAGDGEQASLAWTVKRWDSHRWRSHAESLMSHQVLRIAV